MYKNLNPESLGISGRQSEFIELSLTYGFKGFDIDIDDVLRRAEMHGTERAARLLESAKIKIGGFDLPIDWRTDDESFKAELAKLEKVASVAASLGADRCVTQVLPANDELPYHENFEFHRSRLAAVADFLARHNIRLAVGMSASILDRQEGQFQFIHQTDEMLTLLKTIPSDNIGLLLDHWHWHVGGGTVEHLSDLTADKIVSVRLADLPADADPAAVGPKQRLLPGEVGTIDTPALLTRLAEMQYEGPVTAYPNPTCFQGLTREAIVQRVSESLAAQYSAAGVSPAGKLAQATGS